MCLVNSWPSRVVSSSQRSHSEQAQGAQAFERVKAIGIGFFLKASCLVSTPDPTRRSRNARRSDEATPAMPIEEYDPKLIANLDISSRLITDVYCSLYIANLSAGTVWSCAHSY